MKKVIIIFISLVLIFFLSVIFIVHNNNKYENNILNEVRDKYSKDVSYVNKYLDNYVVKTKDKVVVLNSKYEEVTSMNISDLYESSYDLVYRKNVIMYEKVDVDGINIIYTYYDVKSGEEIEKVEIEGQYG